MPSRKRYGFLSFALVDCTDPDLPFPFAPPHIRNRNRQDREASRQPQKHADPATRHGSRARAVLGELHKVAAEDGLFERMNA